MVLGIRSIFYVDGISLYYAAQTGTRHRRLDLQGMCARLRPHDDIRTIYYFAVPADGLHGTAEIAYLIPLRPHPVVNIIAGDYEHMSDDEGVSRYASRKSDTVDGLLAPQPGGTG